MYVCTYVDVCMIPYTVTTMSVLGRKISLSLSLCVCVCVCVCVHV